MSCEYDDDSVSVVGAVAPVTRRVRAYFAPVNRAAGVPTVFDAAQMGAFALECAAGAVGGSGMVLEVCAEERDEGGGADDRGSGGGAEPGADARWRLRCQLEFESWGKLQLALAAGSQQMNLLQTATGAAANGSGGVAAAAVPLAGRDRRRRTLNVGAAAAAQFQVGELVAVDVDYVAQVGFVGSGVSAAM